MSENKFSKKQNIEKHPNLKSAKSQILKNKKIIKKLYEKKIKLIEKLTDYQTQLTVIYFTNLRIKDMLGEVYDQNMVVDNALLSMSNLTYSIPIILQHSFYGSTRVLLRQYFEYLIIGIFSEFDNGNIIKKWEQKTNDTTKFNINLSHDILCKLKGKDISAIQKTWKDLSDMSHPTKFSQQVPFVLTSIDTKSWMITNHTNMEYTFDLFFMLLCMNYHLLISNWGKKSRRWYMGYDKDPMGDWKKEKIFKEKIKSVIKEYYKANNGFPKANKGIKKVIFQYKQNWIVK